MTTGSAEHAPCPVLRWPHGLRADVAAWARRRDPREACGLLIGRRAHGCVEVVEVREARNLAADRAEARFELDPLDHLAAEEHAAARGLEVVGVWHSHPDAPARPSEEDRAGAWSGWSHAIVGLTGGRVAELRAWRLLDGRFVEQVVTG